MAIETDTQVPESGQWWFAIEASITPNGDVTLGIARVRNMIHAGDARVGVPDLTSFAAHESDVDTVIRGVVRAGRILPQRLEIRVGAADGRATKAPSLGYVYSEQPAAVPPALHLLAFADLSEGEMLSPAQARERGLDPSKQVAAVEWHPETGFIRQVYVAPAWRRKGVATKLLVAAELVRSLQGTPPLHGGALRTDLGDAFLEAAPPGWSDRLQPRTGTAPPMTPPGIDS